MPATNYTGDMTGGAAVGGNQTITKTIYTKNMAGPDTGGVGIGGDFQVVHRTANHATVIGSGREIAFTTK